MSHHDLDSRLAEAIDAESLTGLRWGWPHGEMAAIARRRWQSSSRRNKAKAWREQQRIVDLAKGLQAHFEPDGLQTPFAEWQHLAQVLARVFIAFDSHPTGAPD